MRWFAPATEINLCGHATIASARYLFGRPHNAGRASLRFTSDNGTLYARREGALVAIDLPASALTLTEPRPGLLAALGVDGAVACAVSSDDVLVELASASAVAAVRPDFAALAAQPFRGHIVTARGAGVDFVSRTFFPALGVDEDQVCVTAHCKLTPYWARRLARRTLTALQLSERGAASSSRTPATGSACSARRCHARGSMRSPSRSSERTERTHTAGRRGDPECGSTPFPR